MGAPECSFHGCLEGREFVSSKANGSLPGTPGQAATSQRCHSARFGSPSRLFPWKDALVVIKPATLIGWRRKGFRLFWRWKSKAQGQPRLPVDLRKLIVEMAEGNPTWGEERIAAELLLKLGIRNSPRTVGRYMPENRRPGPGPSSQRWATFVRNHAQVIVACDFFVAVTATFRVLYVFVVTEVGTRRITHFNATNHPTAEWTVQ